MVLLFATIFPTNSRSLACAQWLSLAIALGRVGKRRLVFENELKSEPYKPTQEPKTANMQNMRSSV
eukprot:6050943-Pleurochrysis_carterae.AAC.1